jgi:hypothetical protein
MNFKEILSSRHNVQRVTKFLRAADRVLDSVYKASDGSRLSQGLAIAGAVGTVLDALIPDRSAHDQLVDMGYTSLNLGLGGFFCSMLLASEVHRHQLQIDATTVLVFFRFDGSDSVAAVYVNDEYSAGPYVIGGRDEFATDMRGLAWGESRDLLLDSVGSEGGGRKRRRSRSHDYVLQPLEEPGAYFGSPGLEWFTERLQRHEGQTRSMLLVGPTGVGKSTLGRLIARGIEGGKLIKVGARVIRGCSVTDLVEVAEFLQPDVLLLDDISMIGGSVMYRETGEESQSQMLELMEGLHGKARLVIATLMLEPGANAGGYARRRSNSGDYFSGMRPGRVDEVVRVKRPGPKIREKILGHYLENPSEYGVTAKILKDVVSRTEGLTGAYLKEVVHRIKVHGVATYKGEIKSVQEHAPKLNRQSRRNSRGLMQRRARKRRKTAWEKRYDEATLKNEALTAKNEALSLKLKEAKKKK